jgi:hypothetical protein
MKRLLRGVVLPALVLLAATAPACERVCIAPKGNGNENGGGAAGGLCIPA